MPEDLQRSFDELTRLSTLEKAAVRGNLAAHLQRLRALAAALPSGSPPAAMTEGLAAALQVDLAFLCSRPDALASTLLWRCSPHESERGPIAALVQRWREELPREPVAIEGIRALTPLPYGPGGPLIAELPMAVPHQLFSPMTREGRVLLQLSPRTPEAAFRHWIVGKGTLVEAPEARVPVPP